ncbi:competence type IV pilus minor pilin ComGD [Gracilibacillus xinjiangensis]|uniref:Competence type IV pilus minor pilin ComGD n=1 Tax=Gracilibacillus xinjiangensis TaxID=1193282 RepID=A0ABV8WWI5_9BACI
MNSENGFTLIELLVVLSAVGLLFIIGQSVSMNTLENRRYQQFLEQFNHDLLYLQQLNTTSKAGYILNFELEKNKYHVKSTGRGNVLLTREYPDNWVIDPNTLKLPILFSKNGTLKQPGTLKVKTNSSTHFITCPFGKGRCYSEE